MFASWAISQEHIDALQVDHCPPVEDGGRSGFRPGISISNTNGCAPAIAVVTELAQSLAARYLSGSTTAAPPVPGIAHPELAAKIDWSKLSFSNLEVYFVGEIDADGTIRGPGLTAGPKLDAATLADLQRQATSLDLVNAWPGSCAPVGTFPDLWLTLAPAIVMQTSTQGLRERSDHSARRPAELRGRHPTRRGRRRRRRRDSDWRGRRRALTAPIGGSASC